MVQGDKITIIWDEHEPPKNYIWVHDSKAYEYNGSEGEVSEYNVVDLPHNGNKATMIYESNTMPPDNYIGNRDGKLYVCNDGSNGEEIEEPEVEEPEPEEEPEEPIVEPK